MNMATYMLNQIPAMASAITGTSASAGSSGDSGGPVAAKGKGAMRTLPSIFTNFKQLSPYLDGASDSMAQDGTARLFARGGLAQATQGGSMSKHFNGVIDVEGQPVRVVDGVVDFEGERFFVSDDGHVVIDKDRRFVGIIQNGKFVLGTPEVVDQLRGSGIFHGEQS